MKKFYTIFAAFALVLTANAQDKGGMSLPTSHAFGSSSDVKVMPNSGSRATGDSLMYMPLPSTFVNATDAAAFTIVTEDNDGLPTTNPGYAMSFGLYYSTDSTMYGASRARSNFYHSWETPFPAGTDSAFFWAATSWFTPAGVADNWLEFGPITIPAGGASLKWEDRSENYRDGYEVLVSNTPSSPLSFADFTTSAIFTRADAAAPSPTISTDTTWVGRSVTIPAMYNGQAISFAIHHNANDMDKLYLDDIRVIEGPAGVTEFTNGAKLSQNMPNPTNGVSVISYELEKSAQIAFNVFDVTGKVVYTENVGEQSSGNHNVNFNSAKLSAGVYYYSLTVNSVSTASMKMVVIK